jgi:hypothetical protein
MSYPMSKSQGNGAAAVASKAGGVRKKNLSLNEASLNTIERLKVETDAATAAEIVRRALRFYELAVEKQKEGGRIFYENGDGKFGFVLL